MVLAEAAAAGLPILAAESGAIPEVLRGAGTLFPPGDWRALAGALGELLASPPERRRPAALGPRRRIGEQVEHRRGDRSRIARVEEQSGVADDLRQRAGVRAHDGTAA